MKSYFSKTVIISVAFFILVSIFFPMYSYFDSPISTEKTEWSILQSIESKNRGKLNHSNIIIEKIQTGNYIYTVLGVAMVNNNEFTWVLLNSKDKSVVRQLPSGDYILSDADLEQIKQIPNVNNVILQELKSHNEWLSGNLDADVTGGPDRAN